MNDHKAAVVPIKGPSALVNTLIAKFGNKCKFMFTSDSQIDFVLGDKWYTWECGGSIHCSDLQAQTWLAGVLSGKVRNEEGALVDG